MPKRHRLPNGFGQISKITTKYLRNPYRAMVTTGFNQVGRPISKVIGYYPTYNDAYMALMEYNKNPYDLSNKLTVSELYEQWKEVYFSKISSTAARSVKSAWTRMSAIGNMQVRDVRVRHIKGVIQDCNESNSIKSRMKSTFNLMFDYAVEMELTDQNYARQFNLEISREPSEDAHTAFTEEEIAKIKCSNSDIANIILFQIYTGFRPQELCKIETSNVKLDENIIIGGMKTKAGKNRIVPIHPAIRKIVEEYQSNGNNLLFGDLTYDKYRHRLQNITPNHKAHDGRKTFITLAKKYNVDEYAIKYIVGHAVTDLTEKVYTERDISWLQDEINKIPIL